MGANEMTEFEFLDAQFRRLKDARELRSREENRLKSENRVNVSSAFETAELMIEGAICDYLKMRNTTEQK
jgi:hypothetical protein